MKTLNKELINSKGPFIEAYSRLDPQTIFHADEIMEERKSNYNLRNYNFWTADTAIYAIEDGEAILYLTRGSDNPIFNNLEDVYKILKGKYNDYYSYPLVQTIPFLGHDKILKIELSKLKYKEDPYSWEPCPINYFTMGSKYSTLNKVEKKFAKKIFGNSPLFPKQNKNKAAIFTFTPEYVKEKLAFKNNCVLLTPCKLDSFNEDIFGFFACSSWVSREDYYIRGHYIR
jgi:hypothetical protein